MNERIRELAEQAGFQYIKDEGIGWAGNYNSSLPKFAELIVRECAKDYDDNNMKMGTKVELDFEVAIGITAATLRDDLKMVEEDLQRGTLQPEDVQIHVEVRDAIKTLLSKWYGVVQ